MHPKTRDLFIPSSGRKVVQIVLDGLGGLPHRETGATELDTAKTPNLDRLASRASLGRMQPIEAGVTPGSGPAHLALWGYHPYEVEFGRGALEALGSDFDLMSGDLAARANFATVDAKGVVRDRRAGRPPDAENVRLCGRLRAALERSKRGALRDVEVFLLPGKEHRFTVVFRGEGLDPSLNDNDPQREGLAMLDIVARDPAAARSARVVDEFLTLLRATLADEKVASGALLRGFSGLPRITPFDELYAASAGAIAAYPMYRGVARLAGMKVLGTPKNLDEEVALLECAWAQHDFFFLHYKDTDSAGHSGDFDEKVRAIEAFDAVVPRIIALRPEVVIVTGDHSTPCIHEEHTWHPVPTMIWSPLALYRSDARLTERDCLNGDLGTFPATHLVTLALAHAARMKKFGA